MLSSEIRVDIGYDSSEARTIKKEKRKQDTKHTTTTTTHLTHTATPFPSPAGMTYPSLLPPTPFSPSFSSRGSTTVGSSDAVASFHSGRVEWRTSRRVVRDDGWVNVLRRVGSYQADTKKKNKTKKAGRVSRKEEGATGEVGG